MKEQLAFLAVGRGGQGDDANHARADLFRDDATLAGGVPAFEDDDDSELLFFHPFLVTELDLKLAQFLLVILALHLR